MPQRLVRENFIAPDRAGVARHHACGEGCSGYAAVTANILLLGVLLDFDAGRRKRIKACDRPCIWIDGDETGREATPYVLSCRGFQIMIEGSDAA